MNTSEQNIVATAQIQKQLDAVYRALGIEKSQDDLALRDLRQETVSQSPRANERFDEEPAGQNSAYEEQRKHSFIKLHAESKTRFVESQASFAKAQARFNHQMSDRYKKN